MDCLPPENWKITPENSKGRVVFVLFITEDPPQDLRDRCVCSIDPPGISFLSMLHNELGCKDIDDALHARQLSNGNYEIGIVCGSMMMMQVFTLLMLPTIFVVVLPWTKKYFPSLLVD